MSGVELTGEYTIGAIVASTNQAVMDFIASFERIACQAVGTSLFASQDAGANGTLPEGRATTPGMEVANDTSRTVV